MSKCKWNEYKPHLNCQLIIVNCQLLWARTSQPLLRFQSVPYSFNYVPLPLLVPGRRCYLLLRLPLVTEFIEVPWQAQQKNNPLCPLRIYSQKHCLIEVMTRPKISLQYC